MSILTKTAGALTLGLLVSACDRTAYETQPVVLKTDSGDVTCQLYTVERVLWDHAIMHPEALSKEQADALCFAEGERRKAAYKDAI